MLHQQRHNLLTTGQAAARLGVAIPTVKRWIERGALDAARVRGRWLVTTASVQRQVALRETLAAVANEGFPDRNYNPDGTLVSRKQSNAIIEMPEEVAAHALQLIEDGILFEGKRVQVDTLCLHGDHARVVENAKLIRDNLLT